MKPFKWIDWSTLHIRLGEGENVTVKIKYYGDIVDNAAELQALGTERVDALIAAGRATFDLKAPLDEELVKRLADELESRELAEARATKSARECAKSVKLAEQSKGVFGEDAARGAAIPGVGLPPNMEA
jgi:hypothetical protein